MANYPYVVFGCDCNIRCTCMLCGIKAADCKYAECKKCDKITGHLGCQNKSNEAGNDLLIILLKKERN